MDGIVDYRGRPISRSSSGRFTSALFIIGIEIAERMAYFGISFNLISYLTGHFGLSTADAAAAVNTWSGVSLVLPLLGAFVADSYIGRYQAIVLASFFYVTGLGLLTISAVLPNRCSENLNNTSDPPSCSPSALQVAFFYLSLYLVAFAEGGHRPCVQAFGADQFDENDIEERIARSSFFNWWFFGLSCGLITSFIAMSYIQDNVGWGLGFGIPCVLMAISLLVFLLGSRTYRCYPLEGSNPFFRIGKGMAAVFLSRDSSVSTVESGGLRSEWGCQADQYTRLVEDGKPAGNEPIQEAKGLLRLFPIWAACLAFAIVSSQDSTFFNKQGKTMARSLAPGFQVPPAALSSIISISILVSIPLYDRLFVPAARNLSGLPAGITLLQRIGTGLFISVIAMAVAALVETKRIKTAVNHGLIDEPDATVPMSIMWLLPQYILFGVMQAFSLVGLQELFYDQVPGALRSLGLALYLSILGVGSFISGLLVSVIDQVSRRGGGESWFPNNLNRAHLDYFYWLLAGLSAVASGLFILCAKSYEYKAKSFNS